VEGDRIAFPTGGAECQVAVHLRRRATSGAGSRE
jgi:hypothetical protein